MTSDEQERELMREGRQRLRDLLPAARAEVEAGAAWRYESASAVFEAATPYIREDNFDALVVSPASLGGWHADLHLKRTAIGISDVLGTAVGHPLTTREEAEAVARLLLVLALQVEKHYAQEQTAPRPPAFLLGNLDIALEPAALEAAVLLKKVPETQEEGFQLVEAMVAEVFPGGITKASLDSLSLIGLTRVMSVLHRVAPAGVYAYPCRRPAAPSAVPTPTNVEPANPGRV